ncbi:MAG: ABC transporter permease [Chloroflexi bacterium]|nr:ABC transporter permease [Chloroflexota bacterium]
MIKDKTDMQGQKGKAGMSQESSAIAASQQRSHRLRGYLAHPELVTVALIFLAFIAGSALSPYFLDAAFLFNYTSLYIEVGIMAIGMTFIIISGNIDLSVASMLALVACVAGVLYFDLSVPLVITIGLSLALGTLLGAINGVLVTRLKLPALAVTLATLALYRGAAQVLMGDDSRPKLAWSRDVVFPEWFTGIHRVYITGTPIPVPLVIFLLLAIILGIVLHKTTFGRWVYAIGSNELAAHYSGIPTERLKIALFALSGLLSGLAGIIMVSRLSTARYDHARGWELDVITAVVLGGTDIFGGRGTMFGTVAAYLLIIILRTGMGVANIKADSQLAVIGSLLIIAILVSNLTGRLRRL